MLWVQRLLHLPVFFLHIHCCSSLLAIDITGNNMYYAIWNPDKHHIYCTVTLTLGFNQQKAKSAVFLTMWLIQVHRKYAGWWLPAVRLPLIISGQLFSSRLFWGLPVFLLSWMLMYREVIRLCHSVWSAHNANSSLCSYSERNCLILQTP